MDAAGPSGKDPALAAPNATVGNAPSNEDLDPLAVTEEDVGNPGPSRPQTQLVNELIGLGIDEASGESAEHRQSTHEHNRTPHADNKRPRRNPGAAAQPLTRGGRCVRVALQLNQVRYFLFVFFLSCFKLIDQLNSFIQILLLN